MISLNHPGHMPGHICIIVHQLGMGGVERVAAILANGFARRGIHTELLVCARGGPAEDVLLALAGDKVTVRFFRKTCGHRARDLVLGFSVMGRYLAGTRPELVLSAGNNVSMFTTLLVRSFCSFHTRLFVKTTNPVIRPHDNIVKRFFRRLWYTIIFRTCDGVLTLSDSESSAITGAFPALENKLLTVSNPYVTTAGKAGAGKSHPRSPGAAKQLIAIGRMQKQKRFDILLHAFNIVRQTTDCRLCILGDGEQRGSLETLSRNMGIADLVEMPGFVSNVSAWLDRSDLFVLSSNYEGLPAVVLESLAQNCPVVATECFHGAHELLRSAVSCGVVKKGDPRALADGVIKSLECRRDTSSLRLIAEKYRIEPAIDNHLEAICRINYQHELLACL